MDVPGLRLERETIACNSFPLLSMPSKPRPRRWPSSIAFITFSLCLQSDETLFSRRGKERGGQRNPKESTGILLIALKCNKQHNLRHLVKHNVTAYKGTSSIALQEGSQEANSEASSFVKNVLCV
jgi:hypothetical protein